VPNTCEQGAAARDALCKFLYARVFEWLVDRINASLIVSHQGLVKGRGESGGSDGEGTLTINILDIFGFEFFERNSFEQFCINYANEQLQHQFNSQMLKVEQDEYQAQQIPWEYVVYPDNQPCVSLIEARPGGMLALLDEEGRIPRGSDEGFMNKVREISSVCLSCPFARKKKSRHPPCRLARTPPQLCE
jgi:myosin-5